MQECKVCKIVPQLLGKKFFLPLFGHHYPKLTFAEIQPHLSNLRLDVVGGVKRRGWTVHDIDLVGAKADVHFFADRLKVNGVTNPIHYCGDYNKHSHLNCVWNGIKMTFTGKGY